MALPVPITCLVATTPDRRQFWPAMFRCFQSQSWQPKQMLLIDEEEFPGELPRDVRHMTVLAGTSIGEKLNLGVEASSSSHFHKWDDDDWFGPCFLDSLIQPLMSRHRVI